MSTATIKVQSHSFQHQGLYPVQQDVIATSAIKPIYVVADGFGDSKIGEKKDEGFEVAQDAAQWVQKFLEKESGDSEATMPFVLRKYLSLSGNILFNSLLYTNQQVVKKYQQHAGVSMTCAFLDGDLLSIANVGSGSAWMIRDGQWQEILAPRTLSRLEKPTQRDSEVGQTLPLVALGVSDDVEPEIMEVRCQPGDVVILQSVGVRQPLREELVQNFLEQHHLIVRDESSLKNSIYENASLLLITFAAESTL